MEYNDYLSQLKQTVPFTYPTKHLYDSTLKQITNVAMKKISDTSFLDALQKTRAQLINTNDEEIKFHCNKIIAHTGHYLNNAEFVNKLNGSSGLFIGVRGLSNLYGIELLRFLSNKDYLLLTEYNDSLTANETINKMLIELNNKILAEHNVLFGIKCYSAYHLDILIKLSIGLPEDTAFLSSMFDVINGNKDQPSLTLEHIIDWSRSRNGMDVRKVVDDFKLIFGIK